MRKPVGEQEGIVLREIRFAKYQQKFAPLVERLNGVREPRLEVPQVTGQNVVNEVPTLLVDAGNPASPGQHQAPLSFLVPMQLTVGARLECHVHPRDILGSG